jgi:murein DD-endopeptidase MepM/ murein hydrolase activator NlpD/cephalosporin-C deacetylase-like acetyl esterase
MKRLECRRTRGFAGLLSLFLILAGLFPRNRHAAADELTVLRPEETPRTMLYQALLRQAEERLAARRKEAAALKTPEAIQDRQKEIRARFRQALGDLPPKTPLNARVVGRDQRDGYSVERVIYESRPGHHVTAALYLPDGKPPFPGVLVPCGHSTNGKAAETYQRISILLAKNGMVALCYDPISQGERMQALDLQGRPLINGSTSEHTMAGIGALLVGRSAATYAIHDGIRSLDYLASRPEVDPARLGCTGNSGGGTLTAYLMALDDRIAAAAPSCYITSLGRLFATIGPQDAEQNITDQVAFGMDHADYVILRAPKPTLLSVGTQDFFDIQGSWDTFREVKLVYGRLGYGERVDLFESDEPHGFTLPRRQAAMRWLRRWLLKADDAPVETAFAIATDAQLQCTASGQVLNDFHGKSVFDLNAERAAELARQRADYQATHDEHQRMVKIAELIGLRDEPGPAKRSERGVERREGYTLRKLVFETEPGIVIPALLVEPDRMIGGHKHLTVMIGYNSENSAVKHEELLKQFGKLVTPLLIVDLRGMGETAPTAKSPFGADWKEAFLGLHLGRPLLGQRVRDLLSVIAAMEDRTGNLRVPGSHSLHLEAYGTACPIALHAALLPAITSVGLNGMTISWSDVARAPVSRDQLANVVPGALAFYDLPNLAAMIAPRELRITAMVDAAGLPVTQERIDQAYARCTEAYARADASRLELKAGPAEPARASVVRTADLSIGESQTVTLANGKPATVKLVSLEERRDPIRDAVREAKVTIEVNGKTVTLSSGNYNLPLTVAGAGVQVDCPITGGYRSNSNDDPWGLVKDARIRLWPAGAPLIDPMTFVYPGRQRWLASSTQMANEPTYVDGGEEPSNKKIYYHNGLDIGGAEGLVDVVAATDGFVVSSGTALVKGFENTPARPRYDVVYLVDDQGWYYRYSHLQTIDATITPGATVRMGQKIGVLGKEGGSGGWSHLHFDITSRQPSGKWGTQEGYAFLWQAVLREQKPEVVAVARPHRFTWAGEPVRLDGAKSWSRSGPIASFDWTFSDGTTATGAKVERTYEKPGAYSEVLKVTDRQGHVSYDFAIVQVLDRSHPDQIPPSIHAAYAPTFGIKPGDPVTFKVRTFRSTDGQETWDFGDGSPPVQVHSDGNVNQHAKDGYAVTEHRYAKPGLYLVRVERTDRRGATATARLAVSVEP